MEIVLKITVFSLLFILLYKLIEPIISKRYSGVLLSDRRNYNADLPSRLACAVLPKKCVFRSLSLPVPGRDGYEINIGTVIVGKSGVFILCQIHGSGLIENSQDKKWCHMQNGKCAEFDNPFTAQRDARALIEYYAKNSGIEDFKAHTLILYTDPTLRFTVPQSRSVIYAGDFASRLSKMEKFGRLSSAEVRGFCKLLSDIDQGAVIC